MSWILKKLGGAVIAGVGWKLGSDAYDYLKKRLDPEAKEESKPESAEEGPAQDDAAAPEAKPANANQRD